MTTQTSIYEYAKQNLKGSEHRTALWFYGKRITFGALFKKIDAVAEGLYREGVRCGTVVSIHMPNCPQTIYAVYAVAKLGGICNMVHPQLPLEALRANMKKTESQILITTDCFKSLSEVDFAQTIICAGLNSHMGQSAKIVYGIKNPFCIPQGVMGFENLEKEKGKNACFPPAKELADKCVCYMHSSGTTGEPKIVMHSHQAFNNWVADAMDFFKGENLKNDICLTVLPMFHGSGLVLNVHQFLVHKGAQVLTVKFNAKQIVRLIQKYRVTSLVGVPAMYRKLLNEKTFDHRSGLSIRQCYVSGDNVFSELKQEFDLRLDPSGQKKFLFEGYGMTEIVSACFSNGTYHYHPEASGYPMVNCQIAVWKDGKLCADGTEGELAVSTNTMMLGYLDGSEDTEKVMFEKNGRQWLLTGDVGRVTKDGAVYFGERQKNVIVRNGYNIYPGEVENCLAGLPFIRQACVVGVKNQKTGSQCVRAYISLNEAGENEEIISRRILEYAQANLFRQAVPEEICFMEELPVNQMGKIDRLKLMQEQR